MSRQPPQTEQPVPEHEVPPEISAEQLAEDKRFERFKIASVISSKPKRRQVRGTE